MGSEQELILMLSCLKTKAGVRTRDDDCTACEARLRYRWHLQELAIEELIHFRESRHYFDVIVDERLECGDYK